MIQNCVPIVGVGVYSTYDGQTYDGVWKKNELDPEHLAKITFKDGCKYEGPTKHMQYEGFGTYTVLNNCKLQCKFKGNIPKNVMVLTTETNKGVWVGKAQVDKITLNPVNLFYYDVPRSLGLPSYENASPNASSRVGGSLLSEGTLSGRSRGRNSRKSKISAISSTMQ